MNLGGVNSFGLLWSASYILKLDLCQSEGSSSGALGFMGICAGSCGVSGRRCTEDSSREGDIRNCTGLHLS